MWIEKKVSLVRAEPGPRPEPGPGLVHWVLAELKPDFMAGSETKSWWRAGTGPGLEGVSA